CWRARKSSAEKMISPRDKLVNGTNSAEKLYILIAHHVEYLRPKQQASQHHDNQNDPSKLFHSNLRFTYLMSLNYHALVKQRLTMSIFVLFRNESLASAKCYTTMKRT